MTPVKIDKKEREVSINEVYLPMTMAGIRIDSFAEILFLALF
jgi:hypothetical protein